jgi:hypothetical protein
MARDAGERSKEDSQVAGHGARGQASSSEGGTTGPRSITPRDLQIRLYQFADDSMQGRQVGRYGNKKGTDYIAAEIKRLGLIPAGDNGTYFQVLPYHLRKFTSSSRLTVNGNPLKWNEHFVAVPGTARTAPDCQRRSDLRRHGGRHHHADLRGRQAAGKFVVLSSPQPGRRGARWPAGRCGVRRPSWRSASREPLRRCRRRGHHRPR